MVVNCVAYDEGCRVSDVAIEDVSEVLKEGKQFDEEMTRLAEEEINPQMMADGEMDDDDTQEAERSSRRGKTAKARKRH